MIVLSHRLQSIADKVPAGSRMADIGSDHALLPSYLAERNHIVYAVAGEVNDGPLEAAQKQVKQINMGHIVDVRKGNGLEVLKPREVEVITIAGMGGSLITQILSEGLNKLEGVRQLILQPNVGEDAVRLWLLEHKWFLAEEEILSEDGKIYEIMNAVKLPDADSLNQVLYAIANKTCGSLLNKAMLVRLGPHLITNPTPVFFRKWENELDKLHKICQRLTNSKSAVSRLKLEGFQRDIAEMREVLQCLQKDRR
jgi:tRNA (adenine22-N1)-methyltransferase